MLSLFPELLDWSWYVPFVFRLFLGAYCCYIGWKGFHFIAKENAGAESDEGSAWTGMRTILFILGFSFVTGVIVQVLGSIGFTLAMFALFLRFKNSPHAEEPLQFYLLIGIVSLSLIFLGPGPYAFDLPL
ncbi:MAG: hypothetical protein AAB869_01715 [Patescibacteria group bacterium]